MWQSSCRDYRRPIGSPVGVSFDGDLEPRVLRAQFGFLVSVSLEPGFISGGR